MIAEIPGAIMILADKSNYRNRHKNQTYNKIIIHCTDGKERAKPVAEMWQKPGHGSSAHFVVDQNGSVIQCVPMCFAAFHAHEINDSSVGVEHCARTPGEFERPPMNWVHDPGLPPSSALYAASARLVAYLLVAAGLPADRAHVRGHAESDPKTTHDRCPEGCGWDWSGYMAMVQDEHRKLTGAPESVA